MHTRERNDIFQPLQIPDNQRPMRPRTRIRDIEMVSIFLRWELRAGLILNPVPEDRGLTFEFAALVVGRDPVEDRVFFVL